MDSDNTTDDDFLDGKLLVAMPGMGDPRFERSVVFMCAHSSDGAMGLIVNKPASELKFSELLEQLEIETEQSREVQVCFGGPVEHGRGFVLPSADYHSDDNTMQVTEEVGMTATLAILQEIATGGGPRRCLLALGYAGWGPGQLEGEFQRNGWLMCEASSEILFSIPSEDRWEHALSTIGVSPSMLSTEGGRA